MIQGTRGTRHEERIGMMSCGGRDVSAEWGEHLRDEVAHMQARQRCAFWPAHLSALRLREASSEGAYDLIFADLLRYRRHVDTQAVAPEPRPGLRGRLAAGLHRLLWRLMRFQHERLFFRQNLINSHLAALAEFQARHQAEMLADMSARLDALERRASSSPSGTLPRERPPAS